MSDLEKTIEASIETDRNIAGKEKVKMYIDTTGQEF